MVLVDCTDRTRLLDDPQARALWAALRREHDADCSVFGCREFKRDRNGGIVIARPAEDVDGLVEELLAAGVEVDAA